MNFWGKDMLIVPVLPRFVADMLQEDFLGIVYRATVACPVVLKPFAPLSSVVYAGFPLDKEKAPVCVAIRTTKPALKTLAIFSKRAPD